MVQAETLILLEILIPLEVPLIQIILVLQIVQIQLGVLLTQIIQDLQTQQGLQTLLDLKLIHIISIRRRLRNIDPTKPDQ